MAVLAGVAGGPADALAEGLARLQAAEFLYETSLFPDVEYTFKHALTHEVAYGSLLQDRRRALHARAVEAIERLYPERLAEHVERLAHHALRGEAWEKAVPYLRQAGGKAMARSAYREAAAGFEQALDALRHLPESRARTEQAIDLHLDASGALVVDGRAGEEHRPCSRGRGPRRGAGRRAPAGAGPGRLASRAWMAGDPDRALELAQRALALATAHDDVSLQAWVNQRLGMVGQTTGDYRQAAERLRRVVEALQGDRRYERLEAGALTSVFARDRLAWCLAELGEFAEAMARAEEAGRIAREIDHPRSLVFAYRSLGLVSLRRGDLMQAIPPLERAVELCRVIPAPALFDVSAAHLGYAYALSGRLPEGVALLEEALADPAATGTANHPLFLAYLGEAHLLAGRRDDATRGRPARPRPRPPAEGARQRGVGPAPPRRDRRAGRPSRPGVRRGALPPGPRPGRRARHAPPRRPLPPRPRQALPPNRRPSEGPRAPDHRDHDVPRDGHDASGSRRPKPSIGHSADALPALRLREPRGRPLLRGVRPRSSSSACPACGAAVPPGRKFCGGCGQALTVRPGRREGRQPPESYTPKHLAEKILTSKPPSKGERKQVTVLFADLKGSMELLADRDPEEARKLLDPVLERMMEAVHRYEGTVNQVMGDGIMALFGAPLAHEDHAVRACYAALDMQAAIRRYAEEVRRAHGVEVQIRVGLNSGEVVVRAIGSDLRMDYTAVGQTTHLAARMEQLATPGTTLLTADTLRLAEGYIEVKPLGPVPVKGLERPIERLRADRGGAAPVAAPRGGRPRADPVRRAGGRAGAAPPGARARRAAATARSWRSWGSPAWASRAWSGRSPTRTASTAGSSSRPARSRTARRRPTCR